MVAICTERTGKKHLLSSLLTFCRCCRSSQPHSGGAQSVQRKLPPHPSRTVLRHFRRRSDLQGSSGAAIRAACTDGGRCHSAARLFFGLSCFSDAGAAHAARTRSNAQRSSHRAFLFFLFNCLSCSSSCPHCESKLQKRSSPNHPSLLHPAKYTQHPRALKLQTQISSRRESHACQRHWPKSGASVHSLRVRWSHQHCEVGNWSNQSCAYAPPSEPQESTLGYCAADRKNNQRLMLQHIRESLRTAGFAIGTEHLNVRVLS